MALPHILDINVEKNIARHFNYGHFARLLKGRDDLKTHVASTSNIFNIAQMRVYTCMHVYI